MQGSASASHLPAPSSSSLASLCILLQFSPLSHLGFYASYFISPRKRGRTRLGALAAHQPAGTTGPATSALASFTESPRLAPFNDGLSRLARTSLHRPSTSCVCVSQAVLLRAACLRHSDAYRTSPCVVRITSVLRLPHHYPRLRRRGAFNQEWTQPHRPCGQWQAEKRAVRPPSQPDAPEHLQV